MDSDQKLLLALKFVRMLAYGQTTMILVPFLSKVQTSDEQIGWFMSLTLLGDVLLSALITSIADRYGRRKMLALGAVAMLFSGLIFAASRNIWVLLLAAVIGVVSPSGDEVGPFRAIEESTIAHLTAYHRRPKVYAWQNFWGIAGLAFGSLTGGWLHEHIHRDSADDLRPYQVIFNIYAFLAFVSLILVLSLSSEVEICDLETSANAAAAIAAAAAAETAVDEAAAAAGVLVSGSSTAIFDDDSDRIPQETDALIMPRGQSLSPEEALMHSKAPERHTLTFCLCFLFGIDSLAYSFMTNSWLVEYMERTFGSTPSFVGQFFFASSIISAVSSVPSAVLTHKVGPVLLIGITKIGAAAFGGAVPLAHTDRTAMSLVLFRSLFDTMDVVPRQVFLSSIVPSNQRTQMLGLVNVIKTLARSIGPAFTGLLAAHGALASCFYILGALELLFAMMVMIIFL